MKMKQDLVIYQNKGEQVDYYEKQSSPAIGLASDQGDDQGG